MEDESGNLQNDFFNTVRKDRTLVSVFLANGKRLEGRVKSFDKFTILLEGQQGEQIVYKHAISTVSLTSRLEGRGEGAEGEDGAVPSHAGPSAPASRRRH